MHLTLSPMRGLPGQAETTLAVSGDTITVDGTAHDLSGVPEGGAAFPQGEDHPFIGKITRQDDVLHVTVRVVLGDDATAHQPTDPAHWIVDAGEGAVTIPATRKEIEDAA